MLLRLVIVRLVPLLSLRVCKDRKSIKTILVVEGAVYVLLFVLAAWRIISKENGTGILFLLLSIFPHYLCYGFSLWLLIRCVWNAWSDRVWKRIYGVAMMSLIVGILFENYWNPKILQFFCNFFN